MLFVDTRLSAVGGQRLHQHADRLSGKLRREGTRRLGDHEVNHEIQYRISETSVKPVLRYSARREK